MPHIDKLNFLKNFDSQELICRTFINGKQFALGVKISFGKPDSEREFLALARKLYSAAERTILKENGYYDALQKGTEAL